MKPHNLHFDMITKHIYIGNNACCLLHFTSRLLKEGIRADISLEDGRVDSPLGVEQFLWLPTKDHHPPNEHQFMLGMRFLDYADKKGIKTYVHCKNGHGRAPTLVIAYLMSKGLPLREAYELVKSKRPSAHLSPAQMTALKRLERLLKK